MLSTFLVVHKVTVNPKRESSTHGVGVATFVRKYFVLKPFLLAGFNVHLLVILPKKILLQKVTLKCYKQHLFKDYIHT
jgi:hypothetical protein